MDGHPAFADSASESEADDPSEGSDETDITADTAEPDVDNTIYKVNIDGQKTAERATAQTDGDTQRDWERKRSKNGFGDRICR